VWPPRRRRDAASFLRPAPRRGKGAGQGRRTGIGAQARFGDALQELGGLEGLQVHRSWWVARAAIAAVERDGQRMSLTLSTGLVVPVSRAYQKIVREAVPG